MHTGCECVVKVGRTHSKPARALRFSPMACGSVAVQSVLLMGGAVLHRLCLMLRRQVGNGQDLGVFWSIILSSRVYFCEVFLHIEEQSKYFIVFRSCMKKEGS